MKKFPIILAILLSGLFLNMTVHKADGWISLFDGKTLDGWKVGDNAATFSVKDGAIMVNGPRAHLFYEGPVQNHNFKNFEWKAQVKTMPGSNSGMFIHTTYQETGWPSKGYEIQVNQSHTDWRKTGSVYSFKDVKEVFVKDDEWYSEHIIVQGKKVTVKINDKTVNEYTEAASLGLPTNKDQRHLSSGTIALQGHDPKSTVYYKDIQVKVLPD